MSMRSEIKQANDIVMREFDIPELAATELTMAAMDLWNATAKLGWTDSFGGMEFQRVFPATLAFIRQQANLGPANAS